MKGFSCAVPTRRVASSIDADGGHGARQALPIWKGSASAFAHPTNVAPRQTNSPPRPYGRRVAEHRIARLAGERRIVMKEQSDAIAGREQALDRLVHGAHHLGVAVDLDPDDRKRGATSD